VWSILVPQESGN